MRWAVIGVVSFAAGFAAAVVYGCWERWREFRA